MTKINKSAMAVAKAKELKSFAAGTHASKTFTTSSDTTWVPDRFYTDGVSPWSGHVGGTGNVGAVGTGVGYGREEDHATVVRHYLELHKRFEELQKSNLKAVVELRETQDKLKEQKQLKENYKESLREQKRDNAGLRNTIRNLEEALKMINTPSQEESNG